MGLLIAVVVLVGLLCIANLVLSLRIAGRLSRYADRLDRLDRPQRLLATMLEPGRVIGSFAASTVDGQRVSSDDLADDTLVGFFVAGSQLCEERLPGFLTRAEHHPGGWSRVLGVVIADDPAEAEPLVARLLAVARVVQAPADEVSLRTAFGVHGYPAFGLIGENCVIRASGDTIAALSPPPGPAPGTSPNGPRARPDLRNA